MDRQNAARILKYNEGLYFDINETIAPLLLQLRDLRSILLDHGSNSLLGLSILLQNRLGYL